MKKKNYKSKIFNNYVDTIFKYVSKHYGKKSKPKKYFLIDDDDIKKDYIYYPATDVEIIKAGRNYIKAKFDAEIDKWVDGEHDLYYEDFDNVKWEIIYQRREKIEKEIKKLKKDKEKNKKQLDKLKEERNLYPDLYTIGNMMSMT